jgi:phosphate-selective porin OprO/OprP
MITFIICLLHFDSLWLDCSPRLPFGRLHRPNLSLEGFHFCFEDLDSRAGRNHHQSATQTSLLDFGNSSASPFVPKIKIPARFQQLINLQFAMARGSFWAQTEWYGTVISQTNSPPVFYHGFHVDCGYFLSGEHRAYVRDSGVFGAVKVNRPVFSSASSRDRPRGWGAWELTARFAYLDFFDPNAPLGPEGQLLGVRLSSPTFGVNWYLADHVRLLFNYTYDVPVEPNTGSSFASFFGTRLNVFW